MRKDYFAMYETLVNAIGSSDEPEKMEDLEFVEDKFECFERYVVSIYNMERLLPIYQFRYEGEDYRYHVEELDKSRKLAHDVAMGAADAINRVCKLYGVPEIFDKRDNRTQYTEDFHELFDQFVEHGKFKKLDK